MAAKAQKKSSKTKSQKPKIIVVMPAYKAAETIEKTVNDIPKGLVSEIMVVDDNSPDNTVDVAKKLGLTVFKHPNNLGYGGNQKTCYWEALKKNPDAVVMLHPDYQYDATLIGELCRPILQGRYDYMFGSRIRTREEALTGGMPAHKYIISRIYTLFANAILGVNFSEHFSGLRAYSAKALKTVPFQRFSNNFEFDQEFTVSAIAKGLKIGEIPIPVRYYNDSSSIQLWQGLLFGFGSLKMLGLFLLNKWGIYTSKHFK
jgi:glycosyltransferase involved in cell wall biosynthesis